MADPLQSVKFWKIQGGGLDALGGFTTCSGINLSLSSSLFFTHDKNQGQPVGEPVGVHPTFGDISLTRVFDTQDTLWNAVSKVAQKLVSADEGTLIDSVSLIGLSSKGDPVQTMTLKNAYVSGYQTTGHNAGGTEVLTETVTLAYQEAQLNDKGGLTGTVS